MDCQDDICNETHISLNIAFSGDIEVECPPDKNIVGQSGWALLHTMAAHYPDKPSEECKKIHQKFIQSFSRVYPCKSCASHFRYMMKNQPPELENREKLSIWMCNMHNEVNKMLMKPVFSCDMQSLDERWRKAEPPCNSFID
ncbi:unnamed protein product [Blepharisma stoltei]|uniref:Sulfhydryl oxidase n=1 Tax=Blepharisma stoltei TaxID=1481888 RepID=A0AAU9IKN5_9CILI|nr:unnamed protein product [Blepharisma stoltei]